MLLKGCTALGTGASSGTGQEIALQLARSGCRHIAVNYFGDPAFMVDATVAEIRSLGVVAFLEGT
jgi:NAD(P)-dependent dehydrogenase (short-subunit alcohol dehydrogenase family)